MSNGDLPTSKPAIYADMNIFRYVAYREIEIEAPERFTWVYSSIHLDEIVRNRKSITAGRNLYHKTTSNESAKLLFYNS